MVERSSMSSLDCGELWPALLGLSLQAGLVFLGGDNLIYNIVDDILERLATLTGP